MVGIASVGRTPSGWKPSGTRMRVANLVINGADKKARGYERVIRGYPAMAAGVRRYPGRDRAPKNRPHIHWGNLLSRLTIGGENHSIQIEFLQSCVDPIGTGGSAISLDGLVILVIDGPCSCSMQSGRVSSALRQRDNGSMGSSSEFFWLKSIRSSTVLIPFGFFSRPAKYCSNPSYSSGLFH